MRHLTPETLRGDRVRDKRLEAAGYRVVRIPARDLTTREPAILEIPMSASKPDRQKFEAVLRILNDGKPLPIFIHCRQGADRTGSAVTLYRNTAQNWPVDQSLDEMINGGFGIHKFFRKLIRFVMEFQQ